MSTERRKSLQPKLNRAYKHLQEIDALLGEYMTNNFQGSRGEINVPGSENPRARLDAPAWYPVPDVLAPMIGDAVHNMRSTLDHLANHLVSSNSGNPTEHTAFPSIGATLDTQGNWVRRKNVKVSGGVAPGARTEIDGLQPYILGALYEQHPLWVLHGLWIADKHKALLAAPFWVGGYTGTDTDPNVVGLWSRIETTVDSAKFRFTADDPEVDVHPETTVSICLDQGLPGEGRKLSELLHELFAFTETAVSGCERFLRD